MDYNYAFRAILHASIIIILICTALVITLYLFQSIGLMKIADKLGTPNSWLAFIPVANMYILGKTVFEEAWLTWTLVILDIMNYAFPFTKFLLPGNSVNFAFVTSMIRLALLILICVAFYKLYVKVSDKAVIMLIFTILTAGLIGPIFLFAIRNNPVREQVEK